MAGKKEKKDGTTGSLLPKSIAGIKLPKEVRRKLSDLAKHPIVADLLAAGLVALAAKLKNEPEVKPTAAKAGEGIKTTGDVAAAAAKPVVKRTRKPVTAAAAPAKPVAKAVRKPAATATAKPAAAAKPAAKRKPVAKRKPTGSTTAKPRTPRAPKTPA